MTIGFQDPRIGDAFSETEAGASGQAPVGSFDSCNTETGITRRRRSHWTLDDMRWLSEAIMRSRIRGMPPG